MLSKDNFTSIFKELINDIDVNGKWTNPRNFSCKELIFKQFELTNPLNCLINLKNRKLNYAYLIVEKFTYADCVSKPNVLIAYNSKMKDFLNNDGDFDGAYGKRISHNNQLKWCYELLKNDKDSRQAVITINDYTDRRTSKDIPCTLTLQFLIREDKLNLIVNMRSNDLLWGTCLDVPAFCFIQEIMASWLNVKLGNYYHNAGSLHYYSNFEENIKLLKNDNGLIDTYLPKFDLSFEETSYAFKEFWQEEENIRLHLFYNKTIYKVINDYLEQLLNYWTKKYESKKNK